MILVNLHCSCGQVYKQVFCVAFPPSVKSRLVENNTPQNHAPPGQLYQELANCAEAHRVRETSSVEHARSVFDFMAGAALMPQATQSMFTSLDEDMVDLGHKAKIQKTDGDDHEFFFFKSCDRIPRV